MALGHRLTIVGSDIYNNNLDVKVYLQDYAGAPVERQGQGDVFTAEWGADDKKLPLIYGSEIRVKFWAEVDYEFNDLFTTNSQNVYIEALINDVLFWAGFIEANKWNEPLISARYPVSFSAFDGLGMLSDEDFLNPDKTAITGEYTPREILQIILAKTGLSLPLNTAVDIRPATELPGADPLNQYTIDVSIYEGLSCIEVLEQLFTNCRIQQRGAQWYVISNKLLRETNITFYKYTAAGVANGTTVFNNRVTGFWFEDEPELELQGALKQLAVTQDYGYKENVINNADFSEFIDGQFTYWTPVNVVPQQRQYNTDGDKFIYIPGKELFDPWQEVTRTKYMKSDAIPVTAGTDTFNIKLKFALMGASGAADMFFGVLIKGAANNYVLEAYINTDNGHEIKYRWIAVSTAVTVPYPVPVKSYIKHTDPFPWFTPDKWELLAENIEAKPWDQVNDSFQEASFTPDTGIISGGDLHFFLFTPNTSESTIAGACFQVVSLFFSDEAGNEYPTQTKITLVNNLGNSLVPDELKLINGDTPDVPNRQTIYNGQFKLTDGTPTNTWTIDGTVAAYTYAELIGRLLASEFRTIKQTYKAILSDIIPGEIIVFEDEDNSNAGRYFVEAGITYNFRLNSIEGRFVEMLALNIDTFTAVTDTDTTAAKKTSGKSNTLNPTFSADEKVKLINPVDFGLIGKAGYLSGEYFDQDIDTTTGRAVIRPALVRKIEIAAGTVNGVNKEFTLSKTPVGDFVVYLYPVTMLLPGSFSIVDKTLTLGATIYAPADTEKIIVDYQYNYKEI